MSQGFRRFFPGATDQIPWGSALLSLIPLLFIGPISLVVSYHPGWDPARLPWVLPLYTALAIVMIFLGFILGLLRKFPRWSYPYAILVVILLTFAVTYLINRTPWDINHEGLILLLVVILSFLATRWLPATRPFYANLRHDWTLLSYGLYACTLFLFGTTDHDETPRLNLLVLLPSLVGLLGAVIHLRLASPIRRVAVLLLSMLVGVFLWVLPVFNGMMGSWGAFLVVLGLLLSAWGILVALILAPILINVFIRPKTMPSE